MPNETNTIYEMCPRCQKMKTMRVDRERNLMYCEDCQYWFEI